MVRYKTGVLHTVAFYEPYMKLYTTRSKRAPECCPTRNVEIKLIEKSEPFSKGLLFLEVNGKMLTM